MDGWLKDALGLDSSRGLGTAAGIDDGSLDGSARLEGQQLGRELTASVTSVNSSTDLTSMLSTKGKGREGSKLVAHKPLELKRLSEGWAERGDRRSMGNFTALGNSARKECLSTFCAALESVLDTQQPRLVVVEGRAGSGKSSFVYQMVGLRGGCQPLVSVLSLSLSLSLSDTNPHTHTPPRRRRWRATTP